MSAMRIFDPRGLAVIAAIVLACAGVARADDKPKFRSATEAYRIGLKAAGSGAYERALAALTFAADQGILGAGLKLAKMYQLGQGVDQNDAKAFRYYEQIADQFAEISPRHPIARYVSQAFIELGSYYRSGVVELKIEPDFPRAIGLYRHAASYLGDPDAQFELAKMYLAGEGGAVNARIAVNWLANASKKQHAASQALLGELLWRGAKGVRRQPLKGLALMDLARSSASGTDDAVWIGELYERAAAQARPEEREQAVRLTTRWRGDAPGQVELSNIQSSGDSASEGDGEAAGGEAR